MKIKIHPLFIVTAALVIWQCGLSVFLSSVLAVLLHELAHAFAARQRGYVADNILMLPYGAVLYNKDNFDKTSNVIIALAGPLCNLLLALAAVSFWWLAPETYAYTKSFAAANIFTGLFNVLPVFPLDGSRLVLALTGYKPKALKALKAGGVISSLVFAALFIASLFFTANFTFLIIAVFLFTGGVFGGEKEIFQYMLKCSPIIKDYENGVVKTTVFLSEKTTLKKVLNMVKPDKYLTVIVMSGDRETAVLDEKKLMEIFNSVPLTATLGDALKLKR